MSTANKKIIIDISKKLRKDGFEIDEKSIKKLTFQGFNSEVYCAFSNQGDLVFHALKLVDEQRRQKIYEKIVGVSKFLLDIKSIPNAEIVFVERIDNDKYVFVQKKLPGENLGQRVLRKEKIVDEFFYDNDELYLQHLNEILSNLHAIRFNKFGWLKIAEGTLDGEYESWQDFILLESDIWLKNIYDNRERGYRLTGNKLQEVKEILGKYYEINKELLKTEVSCFIHGDMINSGNVLVKDGKVSGIIDFEWALAGDPAWEFAYSGNKMIDNYFDCCEKNGIKHDRKLFLEKIKFLKIPWLLWAVNVHARGGELKKILYNDLELNLKKYS